MVHTPTITDITSLLYNTDTGTGETCTQVHKHTVTIFGPSTVFNFPNKQTNKKTDKKS